MNPDTNNPAAFAQSGLPQPASDTGRNGSGLDKQGEPADTEDFGYDFVPAKKTITVSVCYCIRGRGQPLPYPLDEGDGE